MHLYTQKSWHLTRTFPSFFLRVATRYTSNLTKPTPPHIFPTSTKVLNLITAQRNLLAHIKWMPIRFICVCVWVFSSFGVFTNRPRLHMSKEKNKRNIPAEKEQQFHKTFQTGISITDPHWRFSFYCWWYTLLMMRAAAGQTLRNYIMRASLVHQSSPTSSNASIYQKCCPMRLLTNKWRDDVLLFLFWRGFFPH